MVNSCSRFQSDQITLAMHHLILMMKQRPASLSLSWATVSETTKPDVRLDLTFLLLQELLLLGNNGINYSHSVK